MGRRRWRWMVKDYISGEASARRPVVDGDLRRRLMAKIGAPLTASGVAPELSGIELVADEAFDSLVLSVYRAVL